MNIYLLTLSNSFKYKFNFIDLNTFSTSSGLFVAQANNGSSYMFCLLQRLRNRQQRPANNSTPAAPLSESGGTSRVLFLGGTLLVAPW